MPDSCSDDYPARLLGTEPWGRRRHRALTRQRAFEVGRLLLRPGGLTLCCGELTAYLSQPRVRRREARLLQLQAPERQLHASAGRCHLLHRHPEPAHFRKERRQDIPLFEAPGAVPGQPATP